jgi:hypothetical protein
VRHDVQQTLGHRRGNTLSPRSRNARHRCQGNPHTCQSAATIAATPVIADQLAAVIQTVNIGT